MALIPHPGPRLDARPGLPGQEFVHSASAAGEHRHQLAALGLVQPVSIGEDPDPGARITALPPGAGQQRHEAMHGIGLRAPGRIVMVVQEGSCWVRRDDGPREDLDAQSVVVWEPGEWVEYGSDGGGGYKIERYWAENLSEEEWKAMLAEVFGPEAVE